MKRLLSTLVPAPLATAAAWAASLLLVTAGLYLVFHVLAVLSLVTVPLGLALLLSALLGPLSAWLRHHRVPPTVAASVVLVASLALLLGAVAISAWAVYGQAQHLGEAVRQGWADLVDWLRRSSLGVSRRDLTDYLSRIPDLLGGPGTSLTERVLRGARTLLDLFGMLLLTLVLTFFLIRDGERLFEGFLGLFGPESRRRMEERGRVVWSVLAHYVRALTIVALVNALLKGLALVLIGIPLVLPLMLVTFVGSFVPLFGPILAGLAAALVAVAGGSFVDAALVIVAAIVIQQLEGNLLDPFVYRRAMRLHPIAILSAITVGLVLGGIVGAFFAVPMLAALVAVAKLHRRQRAEEALRIPGSPAAARQAPPGMEPPVPETADALGAPGTLPGT